MSFFRKLAMVLAVIMIVVTGSPSTGFALELGLNPSQVFGLWTNINNAILTYARSQTDDEVWLRHLSELEPRKFSGKTPEDVLEKVRLFESRLSKLAINFLPHTGKTNFVKEVTFLLGDDSSVVTPSLVFLHSGRILVKIVHAVVVTSYDKSLINPFFAEHDFKDKIPSDVYGLVDLASRRLDKIRIKQRASLQPPRAARQ